MGMLKDEEAEETWKDGGWSCLATAVPIRFGCFTPQPRRVGWMGTFRPGKSYTIEIFVD
jgi:hypothetical protein